jgi:hypothetical protein
MLLHTPLLLSPIEIPTIPSSSSDKYCGLRRKIRELDQLSIKYKKNSWRKVLLFISLEDGTLEGK